MSFSNIVSSDYNKLCNSDMLAVHTTNMSFIFTSTFLCSRMIND